MTGPVVLETNVTVPHVRPEHISRPRLTAALADGPLKKLTLVAAPPGFGKSTFLAEWAATIDGRFAWLSLEEGDNDPARFFSAVIAALQRVEPELGDRTLAALRSPAADLVDVVLPQLLNELAAVDAPIVLVIEDYHRIASADVHRGLSYLIERAPRPLHVVVSTREDPALPLGRLRARGELVEIRADDLRFTELETEQFLNGPLGFRLSGGDVARLQARTEGWPAAIYLAALTLRGYSDPSSRIERFAGDDRYVVDYLAGEVLERQTPELRAFLLETSILERFCGPLCDAVTGRVDSGERLVELERSNLLLVPLDTKREWYRYHHLFGELLRHELELTRRPSLPALHQRAGAWYRDAGLVVEAASHAIAAGDFTMLADIVGRHYPVFVGQGQLATVIGWLEAIPEAAVAEDWLLGFCGAVVYANAGRLDDAERWLALAGGAPQVPRGGQEPGALLPAVAGTIRLLRGDIGRTIENERVALAGVPEAGWTFGPRMVLASGLWWSGAVREAKAVLETASRIAQRDAIPVNAAYARGVRAAIALDEGDAPAAAVLVQDALRWMDGAGLDEHAWTALVHVARGILLSRGGDVEKGAEAIQRGLGLGERLRAWQVIVYASLALAEVRHRRHEPVEARRLLARTRDVLEALPDPGDGFERLERAEKTLRLRATRREASTPSPYWELSPREIEVLRLLPSSLSQRELAAELYVSFNTVRTHTRVIFSKLGVTSRPEAVARARELGLL